MGVEVRVEGLTKKFGSQVIWNDVSLTLPAGEISVMLGPSGTGKSVFLKSLVGLLKPEKGSIVINDVDLVRTSEHKLYEIRKLFGVLFQDGALFGSMNLFDNIAFPLREHTRMSEPDIANEVHRQLVAVGLSDVDALLPRQLSGGMIKRAALARAIIMKPEILLCDEPFSGLDPISVKRIEALLQHINRELQITMLVSSHHIPSTMRMADQVVLLLNKQAYIGSPAELQQSADPRVAGFLNEEADDSGDTFAVESTASPRWVAS